jgi:hypothetical protein
MSSCRVFTIISGHIYFYANSFPSLQWRRYYCLLPHAHTELNVNVFESCQNDVTSASRMPAEDCQY